MEQNNSAESIQFISSEIEPLINDVVNPVAARWLFESQLFKQLQYIVDDGHGHTCAPISNHAVARYLSLQFELVESVFMPINDLIVQCIHISNNISGSIVASATLKLCTHAATLEYLRRTFAIEKAHYWLGMLVKLKKLLYEATSPYYQLISAADATEIRALAAPWKSVVERIKSRHGTNHPVLVLQLLMTQVSCISGWKTARTIYELRAPDWSALKLSTHATHANYRVVLQYFGRLKGALVTCSEPAPLTHTFSFAASKSTLYHTTCALLNELSAEDCASVLHYLRGDQSLAADMLRHELTLVQCIDRWLYET